VIAKPPNRRRRWLPGAVALVILAVLAGPLIWTRIGSGGRLHNLADAPPEDVAIVFGAQVTKAGKAPMTMLAGRLGTAFQLLQLHKVKALLISGSGDEAPVMHQYLVRMGADPARLVVDPDGLDTYDTCRRAHDVYGLTRALLVSQSQHLPRAITLCRRLGVDAYGVRAGCDGCRTGTLAFNAVRELGAGPKAVWEAIIHRPPAVQSSPDPALRQATR
jgi:vancomycin permeability regulator SanA